MVGACPRSHGQPAELTCKSTMTYLSDRHEDGAPALNQAAGVAVETAGRNHRGPGEGTQWCPRPRAWTRVVEAVGKQQVVAGPHPMHARDHGLWSTWNPWGRQLRAVEERPVSLTTHNRDPRRIRDR